MRHIRAPPKQRPCSTRVRCSNMTISRFSYRFLERTYQMNRAKIGLSLIGFSIVMAAANAPARADGCWCCTDCGCHAFSGCILPLPPNCHSTRGACELLCCDQPAPPEGSMDLTPSNTGPVQADAAEELTYSPATIDQEELDAFVEPEGEVVENQWSQRALWAMALLSMLILP